MNYEVIEIRSRNGARTPKSDISTGVKATAGMMIVESYTARTKSK